MFVVVAKELQPTITMKLSGRFARNLKRPVVVIGEMQANDVMGFSCGMPVFRRVIFRCRRVVLQTCTVRRELLPGRAFVSLFPVRAKIAQLTQIVR
jgi:hypothetical protein